IQLIEDTTWASTTADFLKIYGPFKPGKAYIMDRFYRRMRQQTGILMQDAKPLGGKFSFDEDNRNSYKNQIPVPAPPTFSPDSLTQEVISLIGSNYSPHFGTTEDFDLPCTQSDCDLFWRFFLDHLLPTFGRFED